MNLRFSALFAFTLAVACHGAHSNNDGSEEQHHSGMAGSRRGVHGMVLFGSERTFVSHIPTFDQPHDFQVVLEVSIRAGVPENARDFRRGLFTIQPEVFSLYDLAHGDLQSFRGTIFEGNFEAGGTPVFRNVRFDVKRILAERPLERDKPVSRSLDYIAVGTPTDAYLVHVIDAPTSFDQVVAIDASGLGSSDLERGAIVSVAGGTNAERARLLPSDDESARVDLTIAASSQSNQSSGDAGDGGDSSTTPPAEPARARVRAELSCLRAPDFVDTCE